MCASVSSTTLAVDAPGVFTTQQPCSSAAATSMLSTPTPARPMTRSRPAAPSLIAAALSIVAERTMTASKSCKPPPESSALERCRSTTFAPDCWSSFIAEGASPSATRMEGTAGAEKTRAVAATRESILSRRVGAHRVDKHHEGVSVKKPFMRYSTSTGKKTPGGAGTHTGHTSAHADSRFCTFLTDTTALATSSVQRLDNVWRTPIGMLWAPLGSSALS